MEKLRNKVVATDYVEKNYIHKDKIKKCIKLLEKQDEFVSFGGRKYGRILRSAVSFILKNLLENEEI